MKKCPFLICFCVVLLIVVGPTANGQFVTNGNAHSAGNGCWSLTDDVPGQAGSIFSVSPINLNAPFFYSTRLYFGCKDVDGADGIVFIFTTSNNALGASGGGLGYMGITPSIAIEWDDYQNGNFGDPVSDHLAILSNGSVDHNSPENLVGPIALPNIEDCNEHCVSISWTPSTQTLTGTIDGLSISYTGDIINTIFGGNPTVYWGFSSGTGSLSNLHQVCDGPPQVQPMADQQICPGESAQLQADPNGESYFWAPHPTLSGYTIPNPIATPMNTILYNVTITYACGGTAHDDVLVTVFPAPQAVATSNSPVCFGQSLQLMAQGGVSYNWSGPQGFSSNDQNPTLSQIDFSNAGLYTVTVTDANNCTATASTVVTVLPPAVVAIVPPPQPFCSSDPPYTLEGIPAGGTWGGAANSNGQVNPATLGQGIHLVTYTATDPNNCTGTAEIFIEVVGTPNVNIAPAGPFCEDDSLEVLSASPAGGTWGGVADAMGQVFPQQLGPGTHLVTYTAGPPGCEATDTLIISVVEKPEVSIAAAGPYCASDPPDTLTATPAGGVWSGAANSQGVVFPNSLGPGVHQIIYTWADSNNCEANDTLEIEVFEVPQATISGGDTICDNSNQQVTLTITLNGEPPYTISWSVDGQPQPPITTTQDTFLLSTSNAGIYTLDTIADGNGCVNAGIGQAEVMVAGSPQVTGLTLECDSTALQYTLSFNISGGDSSSYVVMGNSGILSAGNPAQFISDPIASGSNYYFAVFDAFGCDTTVISGAYFCTCLSDAGEMDTPMVESCEGDTLTATHIGGQWLDANDTLSFVLHSSNSNALGTVYAVHSTPQFWLMPNMQPGVVYYVSAVVGNDNGSGLVDLNDPCLSVSLGQPVRFNQLPNGQLTADADICEGETTTLVFNLTGTSPFMVWWSNGSDTTLLNGIFNGHTEIVEPFVSTTFTLIGIEDSNTPACSASSGSSVQVSVYPVYSDSTTQFICPGDSIFAGGEWQTEPGVYLDTFASQFGCDSVIMTELVLYPQDTTFLAAATCDPNATGTFTTVLTNQYGCDSTIVTTVSLLPSDTIYLNDSTCDPNATGTFTTVLTNQYGCDSTVVTTLIYSEADTTWLYGGSCDPQQTGVFIENLIAADGCDSIVVTTVSLLPSDTTFIAVATCDPNATGTFTTVLTNQHGCDSIVVTTVSLLPSDTTFIAAATCDPNATGTFTAVLTNQYGCDSTVVITVSLLPSDTTFIAAATCDPNATGTFTTVLTNQYGCDSTVVTTVSLLPSDTTFFVEYSCFSADTGTIVTTLTNQYGCDSTIVESIVLWPLPELTAVPTTNYNGYQLPCAGDESGAAEAIVSGGTPPYVIQWSAGQSGAQATGLAAGQYQVTVADANGCRDTASVGLAEPPALELSLVINNPDCFDQADGYLEVLPKGGVAPYSFALNDGLFGLQSAYPNLPAGTYQVLVQDANHCQAAEIVWLNAPLPVNVDLGADMTIQLGNDTVIQAIVNLPYDSLAQIQWSGIDSSECATCLSQAVAPIISTTYSIEITDVHGCQDADAVTVVVDRRKHIFVPNAFSPNGDGVNDVFLIFAKPGTVRKVKSFIIFSRWGETVFEVYNFPPNDPAYGWNGDHRGMPMDPAVFVWFAEIEFIDGSTKVYEGDVSLVR